MLNSYIKKRGRSNLTPLVAFFLVPTPRGYRSSVAFEGAYFLPFRDYIISYLALYVNTFFEFFKKFFLRRHGWFGTELFGQEKRKGGLTCPLPKAVCFGGPPLAFRRPLGVALSLPLIR